MVISQSKNKKGQAYTLEAIAAAVIILSSIVFAQQVTAITPLTASTASQHVENQQGELAKGFLITTNENGELKRTLLYWDETNHRFYDSSGATNYYDTKTPNNKFGSYIDSYFLDQGMGVQIEITYYVRESDGSLTSNTQPYIKLGTPSNNAYITTTTVPFYDSDKLRDSTDSKTSKTIKSEENNMYMPDIGGSNELYNIVEVKITIWRL